LNQLNKNNFAYYLANEKWELDLAYKLIQEVIALSPNDHHFLDSYGWVLFQQGNFEEALVMFQKAATSAPNDALIMEHVGDANFKLGNHDLGVSLWKKALELGSKDQNLPKKIEKKHYYEPNY
jgi:Tfp pilus assembly protein PilF